MGREIIDISSQLDDFGENVEFFIFGAGTNVEGIVIPDFPIIKWAICAVFPFSENRLELDNEGVKLSGAIEIFTKINFPMIDDESDLKYTRVRYDSRTYLLRRRVPYYNNYYIYVAELLRVDP